MQTEDNTLDSSSQPVRKAPPWLKLAAAVVGSVLLAAVLATAALWWWAGSDGSLATGLRWVAQYQPLSSEGASGSLRKGGAVKRLAWQQDGMTVEAHDVAFSWQPWSLLHATLKLNSLSASTIRVDDQRPASTTPSLPPTALGLPLQIALDNFAVERFQWQGPPAWEVLGISGNYLYTGLRHELALKNAQFANGHYQGKATLASAQPLELDALLSGTVEAPVPGRTATLPLSFNASAKGPLSELALRAVLQMQSGSTTLASAAPHATATARVTPWAAQPLPEADADFRALDIAALWPDAPQTRLTGRASVRPAQATATSAWVLQTQLVNELPGPWDKKRLPLENLQAQGEWRDGAAIVRSLKAGLGGGELNATGEWLASPQGSTPGKTATTTQTTTTRQDWALQATLKQVNPAALHTQFASLPVNGRADVKSQGSAIAFDASLQSADGGNARPARPTSARNSKQLRLRDATATGRWDAGQAGGTLALSAFRVRTDDAEAAGSLEAQPTAKAGKGRVTFTAPGLQAQAQGELRQASGAGTLEVQAKDAAQALRWLQKLPGMPSDIQTANASGNAALTLNWQGGWQDPALQANLQVPSLDWRSSPLKTAAAIATPSLSLSVSSAATAAQVASTAAPENVLKIRALEASINGKLSQAQIALQGRVESGTRRYALQLAADGGRIAAPRQGALDGWANSAWQSVVKQLSLSLEDPALSEGAWRLSTRGNVALRWSPGASGGTFEAGAGEAVLAAPSRANTATPAAPPSQAIVQWQPIRRRGGELSTAGRITGLPLAWIELVAGPQMAGAGLAGNLVFDGTWDAQLGESLRVKASLARSSGDISVQAETAQGISSRVAAGVKEARLSLDSNGDALTLALRWDSERAGTADGQLTTRLAKDNAGGWMWPDDAPLRGQLRAQLPRIGVWSVLAPPGWRLRGTLGANVAISGTRALPQLAGDLTANDLALRSVVDGIEFGNGRLRARLDGTRMRINEFTLQGAGTSNTGGTLTAQGEAAWLDGKAQVQLDARLDRLRASIRTDRQVTLSGDLQAKLEGRQAQFTGNLKVDQARILLPDEDTPQLGEDVVVRSTGGAAAGKKAPAEANAGTPAASESGKLKLAVQIDLGQDFRVQGKGMDTRVRGSLALTGESLTEPRLAGTVNTFGGQYRAYGQRLDVEQGVLRFSGPINNPALDILAIRPNLTQRVGVQITGTALLPRVRLYAQPELPDAEKLSWLVVGRASASGGAEAALLQQAALALLGSKSGGMSGGLASSLGLDELSFRGAASNTDGTTTEGAVTLGKRFSRNFYAGYERSISGALGTLFVFYELSQRFTVRAQAGQQSAVDLIYTFQYD